MRIFKLFLLSLILASINGKNLRFSANSFSLDKLVQKLSSKAFSTVLNKITLIVGMWQDIASTFSTKIMDVMEDYLEGMGFEYMSI